GTGGTQLFVGAPHLGRAARPDTQRPTLAQQLPHPGGWPNAGPAALASGGAATAIAPFNTACCARKAAGLPTIFSGNVCNVVA
nr:hypothetical protein [Tanacetum cinerariifolium]